MLASLLALCVSASATVKPRKGRPAGVSAVVAAVEARTADTRRKVGSQATAPLKAFGSPKVPVVLVQFPNKKFISGLGTSTDGEGQEVPNECQTEEDGQKVNAFYTKFCNGEGGEGYYSGHGSYGAIREYFRDQSFGQFTPEFVVVGPVTLDNAYEYYGRHSGSMKDARLTDFYSGSIKKAQDILSDWSLFDNDGNGSVDMVFFIFAGEGENGSDDENTIWPQERASGGSINGVSYGCYACCNEIYGGKTDGIGVFVHELSHALGLPDFYDTNYKAYGMDYWDVMDSGCYCNNGYAPCSYTAYEREFMGWMNLVTLTSGVKQSLTLKPLSEGGTAYRIVNPENEDEYYVIENRQPAGWDSYLGRGTERTKMHGMMVNHVDFEGSSWNRNAVNTDKAHQRMTLVPADGELYSYMDVSSNEQYSDFMVSALGDLFPGRQEVTRLEGEQAYVYTDTGKTPHQMNQPLTDIVELEDGTITLTFCGDDPTAVSSLFANAEEHVPVYSVAGIVVGYTDIRHGKPTQLPATAGIYIVKGKKYVKD